MRVRDGIVTAIAPARFGRASSTLDRDPTEWTADSRVDAPIPAAPSGSTPASTIIAAARPGGISAA
jgi:hypothetical protein